MSTHNICFCGEIRKLLWGYPLLSVAMHSGPGLHCSQRMIIAPDKVLFFSPEKYGYLPYFTTKTCHGYSLEASQRGTSNKYPQHMFL